MAEVAKRNDIEQGFNTAGEAISKGKTVEQIQTTYHTAVRVQKPRELIVIEKNCLAEAALAGEACFYGWGSGKDRVEAPSKGCAMIAYRNWGNVAMEMRDIHETPSAYIMTAVIIDLETGTHYPRQFRQSKNWKVYGKMNEERKADIRFQIGQTKTQRNCILNFIPTWLTDKMVERAKEGVREKIQKYIDKNGFAAARKLALDALAKLGVSLERIEYKYEKKYGAWDIETLITLKGDIRALSDGAESADSLFPEKDNEKVQTESEGLSTEDMSPGDPKTHQGYEPRDNQSAPPSDDTGDTVEQLMKLTKAELVAKLTAELATTFPNILDADEFLSKSVENKKLRDPDINSDNNTKGQLANLIIDLQSDRNSKKSQKAEF